MVNRRNTRNRNEEPIQVIEIVSSEDEIEDFEVTDELINPVAKRRHIEGRVANGANSTKIQVQGRIVEDEIIGDQDNSQWLTVYEPRTVSEVSINPTKLKQVREVLSSMVDGTSSNKLLVLTGPSGSSKSTTVKLLAKELLSSRNSDYITEYFDNISVVGVNQPNQFEEFLNDCRYKVGQNLSVVLVEELPNIFHDETLTRFRLAISQWIHSDYSLPPLVLCLTEIEYSGDGSRYSFNIENNLNIDTLLGKSVTTLPQVKIIKFNAIANRYLSKTINNIIQKESKLFSLVPKDQLNLILEKLIKIGDVRSTIANLQMWVTSYVNIAEKFDHDEGKLIDATKFLESSYNRENQINLFHAIGKVIYSSTNFLDQQSQDYLSIEQVLNDFHEGNFPILNLSLLENYTQYQLGNYSLDIASEIANDLSINDMMSGGANKEIGLRSTRSNLRKVDTNKAKSYNQKTKFSRHFRMMRQYNKTYNQIRQYQRYINQYRNTFEDLNLIDGYYLPQIYNKKSKTRFRYNRLGGQFKQIYADEELPIDEDYQELVEFDQFQVDIQNQINQEIESDDDGELSDPIEDSDGDDDEEFLDDPELDQLISQGGI